MATHKPAYTLHKPLSNGDYLVRRTTDGAIFLARPLDADPTNTTADSPNIDTNGTTHARAAELIRRGAARPAANLLNHENLISIHDELVNLPFRSVGPSPPPALLPPFPSLSEEPDPAGQERGGDREGAVRRMLLWDWSDAGTLQGVLDEYAPQAELAPDAGGFLPESFVWHVALGLLRALQWLHEGVRDTYDVVPVSAASRRLSAAAGVGAGEEGGLVVGKRWKRVRGRTEPEVDWMPVLHRDLRPANVFLQLPRGVETYGAVKLGNFGRCWVSGSVSRSQETPVVTMESEDEVPLGTLRGRKGLWKRDGLGLDKSQRPYTQGSELYAVGALLINMMYGRALPSADECPHCECIHHIDNKVPLEERCLYHGCPVPDFNRDEDIDHLTSYTAGLKDLVRLLLQLNRSDELRASTVLDVAWTGFESWAANTEDGRLYRDIFNDIWFRKQNEIRFRKRHRDSEEEADFMHVDGDVLVV